MTLKDKLQPTNGNTKMVWWLMSLVGILIAAFAGNTIAGISMSPKDAIERVEKQSMENDARMQIQVDAIQSAVTDGKIDRALINAKIDGLTQSVATQSRTLEKQTETLESLTRKIDLSLHEDSP